MAAVFALSAYCLMCGLVGSIIFDYLYSGHVTGAAAIQGFVCGALLPLIVRFRSVMIGRRDH